MKPKAEEESSFLVKEQRLRFSRRLLGAKLLRASLVVIVACGVAVWLSDDKPKTPKALAQVLFKHIEAIAIASAAAVFLLESSDRKKREQYEAWQVVNSAQGQSGSGGRIQALQDLNEAGVDLEGVSAPNAELSGINLSFSKLRRANLERAQLDQSNLKGAVLNGANLQQANLRGAHLESAKLILTQLEGAILIKAHLHGANLWEANLEGAQLQEADLEGASLKFARLYGANLKGANLVNADLAGARLDGEEQILQATLCRTTFPNGTLKDRDCPEPGINIGLSKEE